MIPQSIFALTSSQTMKIRINPKVMIFTENSFQSEKVIYFSVLFSDYACQINAPGFIKHDFHVVVMDFCVTVMINIDNDFAKFQSKTCIGSKSMNDCIFTLFSINYMER